MRHATSGSFLKGDPRTVALAKRGAAVSAKQHQSDRVRWYRHLGVSFAVGEQIYQAGIRKGQQETPCSTSSSSL